MVALRNDAGEPNHVVVVMHGTGFLERAAYAPGLQVQRYGEADREPCPFSRNCVPADWKPLANSRLGFQSRFSSGSGIRSETVYWKESLCFKRGMRSN